MENQNVLRLIAACLIVQTILVAYLVFGQPQPKVDAKLLNVTNAILDLDARMTRMDQENAVLFRMLRGGNEQYGVVPDGAVSVPLPPDRWIGSPPGP